MTYARGARHPKDVGDETQAMVLARLVQAGKQVCMPFGENVRYDLVIDDGDRFLRVQCKTGRLREGAIRFNACSYTYHHPSNQGSKPYQRDYRGAADLFGIYCPETEGLSRSGGRNRHQEGLPSSSSNEEQPIEEDTLGEGFRG